MTDKEQSATAADAALIEGFVLGDRDSVRTVHAWVARVVRLRAWRLRLDDDLVQDVLVDLIGVFGAGRFEGRSSLQTYVERIAKYRCIDALRRERLRNHPSLDEIREPDPVSDDRPDRQLIIDDEVRLCFLVLSHLTESCRDLLQRVLAEDTPYEDLAGHYDVAVGTIKSRVARCREQAKEWRRRLTIGTNARRKGGTP